jgi:acetyl CoA:N6-hydroxylysine acetyl transferase
MREVTYSPVSGKKVFKASFENGICKVKSNSDQVLEALCIIDHSNITIKRHHELNSDDLMLKVLIEHILGTHPQIKEVELPEINQRFYRYEFYQLPANWSSRSSLEVSTERWTETNGRTHPVRPLQEGLFYRRYLHSIEKEITFRSITIADLDVFHDWHNQPRVSYFWELNQDKEKLTQYINSALCDKHSLPTIVELDGEPVGYYEIYWVQEDRLGPYYEADAYDRGFHFLIGNKKFLGSATTDAIIKAGLHAIYLDDPRTRRVMAEPRHDNQKVLKYAEESIGWRKVKIFDFPHKRAWLLENSREKFYSGNVL